MKYEYGRGLLWAPEPGGTPLFNWLHIQPGDSKVLVMGEVLPLWYHAHWLEGRMRPCGGDGCSWCGVGVGRQRRWVFAVIDEWSKKPYLWEVSEFSCSQIKEILEQQDAAQWVKLRVSREHGNRKGRLDIRHAGTGDGLLYGEIKFPDLAEALELTWQFSRGSEVSSLGAAPSRDQCREKVTEGGREY